MKKYVLIPAALAMLAGPAFAQEYTLQPAAPVTGEQPVADPVMDQVSLLQSAWAQIKYQMPDKDAQLAAIHQLEDRAANLTATYPTRAEPKIWEGIILSTDAGIVKGISALGKVKKAKSLFEASIQQDPQAMEGSAYTSLGSLYYQVPGWPVAFGDKDAAAANLKQALQINPNGIDPNFFYGDFLLQTNHPDEAQVYLEKALLAPDRPGRELADAGRRQEIRAALAQIRQKKKDSDTINH